MTEKIKALQARVAQLETNSEIQRILIAALLGSTQDQSTLISLIEGMSERHDANLLYEQSFSDGQIASIAAGLRSWLDSLRHVPPA